LAKQKPLMADRDAPQTPVASLYKRRRALLTYQRRHRRGAAGDTMTTDDQLELENSVQDSIIEILLSKSVPLWAWSVV
jgi:hypothetical protein